MNVFYKQGRGRMRIYCVSARVIGWLLLVIPTIVIGTQLSGAMRFGSNKLQDILHILLLKWPLAVQLVFVNFMLLGILLLIIARFIRYLNDDEYQPGWLLRHGNAILYACAVLVLAGYIGGLIQGLNYIVGKGAANFSLISSNWILSALPSIGIVLMLVGAGQALSRVMPIIEESKLQAKPATTTDLKPKQSATNLDEVKASKNIPSGNKKYVFAAIITGLLVFGALYFMWPKLSHRDNSFYIRALNTGKLIGPISLLKGQFPPSLDKQIYIVAEPAESELEVRKRLLRPVTVTMTDVPLNEPVDAILAAYFGSEAPSVRFDVADESKMPRVSIDARSVPLYEVLFNIALQANLYISIENGTIILSEKEFMTQ